MGIVSVVAILVLVALSISHESLAQSAGCTAVLISLSSCLNYITGSSPTPPSSCCSRLANVVQSQPQCLCSALNGGGAASQLGVTVNQTRALALPAACDVQTPPVSRCNGAGGAAAPAISPVSSPEGPSDDGPADPPTDTTSSEASFPSGNGFKSIPTTGGIAFSGSMMNSNTPFHLTNLSVYVVLVALLCFVN